MAWNPSDGKGSVLQQTADDRRAVFFVDFCFGVSGDRGVMDAPTGGRSMTMKRLENRPVAMAMLVHLCLMVITLIGWPAAMPWVAVGSALVLGGWLIRREHRSLRLLSAVRWRWGRPAGAGRSAPATVDEALADWIDELDASGTEGECRSLLENLAAAVYLHDGERFLHVNRAACELLRGSREELLGWPVTRVLPEGFAEARSRAARSDRLEHHRRMDGTEVPVEVMEAMGKSGRTLLVVRDVTERLKNERQRDRDREQLQLVADYMPSMVALVDRDERCQFINRSFTRWFEKFDREIVGRRLEDVLDESTYRQARPYVQRALTGTTAVFQHVIHDHAGHSRHFLATYVPHRQDGKVVGFVALEHDITEVERASRRLRESEARYRQLVESSPYCIHEIDADGLLRSVNSAGLRMMGKNDEREVIGTNMVLCAAPEEIDAVRAHIEGALAGQPMELEYRTADGRTFASTLTPLHDVRNRPQGLMGIVRDISESKRIEALRREAEEEVRRHLAGLKALSARLESVREEERKHIAREIHDELGQLLTALKMEIHGVENAVLRLPEGDIRVAMEERVIEAGSLADQTIRSVREIAMRIRPSVLDELGLIPALQHECARFEERAGIRCRFSAGEGIPSLEEELATTCFRLTQEFLTNIARHARATRAEVRLECTADQLVLEVTDDGMGLPENAETVSGHLGLIGARERVNNHQGTLTLDGLNGSGSVVTVRLPLPGADNLNDENPDS